MSLTVQQFVVSLDERVNDILDACTECGACASVCPTPKIAGLTESSEELGKGIVKILQGETITGDSKVWAELCCGSVFCQSVCEEGINPRFMLAMARRAINSREDLESRRIKGKKAFQKMSRGVRVLSRLQLAPDILERLSPKSHPGDKNIPDVVFYTGCNMLKTPHIGLLCLDILERLDFTYEVHGGPSTCCGILSSGRVMWKARLARRLQV